MRLASISILVALSSACVPVYDAQLTDRREELEEHRRVFLGPEERVQFKLASSTRMFWIGLEIPLNDAVLRGFDAANDAGPITYDFTRGVFNLEEKIQVSDELVAFCPDSGARKAYDASQPDVLIGETASDEGSGNCAVSGSTVYFIRGRLLQRWIPGGAPPVTLVDLDTTDIGTGSIAGFAVDGDTVILAEGGRLWTLNMNNPGVVTWLQNESPPEGNVVVGERGVLYRAGFQGLFFVSLPDNVTESIDERVKTGGYRLNAIHSEIHLIDDREDNVLFGDQIIYRGQGGIFAYGIDTHKVQDILLDSEEIRYFEPVVLETGDLYVEQRTNSELTVFTVQLNEVLR